MHIFNDLVNFFWVIRFCSGERKGCVELAGGRVSYGGELQKGLRTWAWRSLFQWRDQVLPFGTSSLSTRPHTNNYTNLESISNLSASQGLKAPSRRATRTGRVELGLATTRWCGRAPSPTGHRTSRSPRSCRSSSPTSTPTRWGWREAWGGGECDRAGRNIFEL